MPVRGILNPQFGQQPLDNRSDPLGILRKWIAFRGSLPVNVAKALDFLTANPNKPQDVMNMGLQQSMPGVGVSLPKDAFNVMYRINPHLSLGGGRFTTPSAARDLKMSLDRGQRTALIETAEPRRKDPQTYAHEYGHAQTAKDQPLLERAYPRTKGKQSEDHGHRLIINELFSFAHEFGSKNFDPISQVENLASYTNMIGSEYDSSDTLYRLSKAGIIPEGEKWDFTQWVLNDPSEALKTLIRTSGLPRRVKLDMLRDPRVRMWDAAVKSGEWQDIVNQVNEHFGETDMPPGFRKNLALMGGQNAP